MSRPFHKPATSIPEQIAILQQRGLVIQDHAAIEYYLKHIGYYRLAGYWRAFQIEPIKHIFSPGTTIEEIIELYNFDRELRLLLTDAIESIEVSFRSVLINEMSTKYGPLWFADPQYAFREDVFDAILKDIDKELERSKEDFIVHHGRKYGSDDYPPA